MTLGIFVDLDDTLIDTEHHYEEQRQEFGQFMNMKHNIPIEEATDTQSSYSYELLSSYGLKIERFPEAMEQAYRSLVSTVNPEEVEIVREYGWSAYKSAEEYQSIGFNEGAEQLLEVAKELGDHVGVLTAGDPILQQRKISALDLDSKVDIISIVEMNGKEAVLRDTRDEFDTVVHIGNSSSSDVEAAESAGVSCIHVSSGNWRDTDTINYTGSGSFHQVKNLHEATQTLEEHFRE
jgi:FMN phosphatase YigB (HAD superfamily)